MGVRLDAPKVTSLFSVQTRDRGIGHTDRVDRDGQLTEAGKVVTPSVSE